jgi:hypothetical protein
VKTASSQLDHVAALGALLPIAALCKIHQELYMRVAGAKTFVAPALAQNAGIFIAKYASGNPADDFSESYEFRAIDVGAIGGMRCC